MFTEFLSERDVRTEFAESRSLVGPQRHLDDHIGEHAASSGRGHAKSLISPSLIAMIAGLQHRIRDIERRATAVDEDRVSAP